MQILKKIIYSAFRINLTGIFFFFLDPDPDFVTIRIQTPQKRSGRDPDKKNRIRNTGKRAVVFVYGWSAFVCVRYPYVFITAIKEFFLNYFAFCQCHTPIATSVQYPSV